MATLLIGAHHGIIGSQMHTPVDASYLADAVILLRYFEAKGEVRQAISVVKKRGGIHERTIREFGMHRRASIRVGEALRKFRGILTGVPVYEGSTDPLLETDRRRMTASAHDLRFLLMAPTVARRRDHQRSAQRRRHRDGELYQARRAGAGAERGRRRGADRRRTPGRRVRKAPLAAWLSRQPPWSDLPILILTRPGADSPESAEAWRTLGNVTLLERPTRVTTLLSAAQTAIRARARQYQIRGHLAERQKTEQALRTADRRKDEFLATLGHELRNPLAPILEQPRDPEALGRVRGRAHRAGRAR